MSADQYKQIGIWGGARLTSGEVLLLSKMETLKKHRN
jgi:hypothetical protein